MNEFQRKRFDNLLGQAENPKQDCIAREHISRAFGYIDGLLEGDAISPKDYGGLFHEIVAVEARIRAQTYRRLGLAS